MEKLIKMLFKACFVLWLLISMLSWVILACIGEIFHTTEKQDVVIALVATLWILVPMILFAAIEAIKECEKKDNKQKGVVI